MKLASWSYRMSACGKWSGKAPARWSKVPVIARTLFALCALFFGAPDNSWAATVPPGFSETVIPGPSGGNWNEALGVCFDANGRMYVWERAGRIWIKDPTDASPSLLLDISEEVG